jgi:uncharacterized membrane protein
MCNTPRRDNNAYIAMSQVLDVGTRHPNNQDMTGTIGALTLATAFFVGGHFILSSLAVRSALIHRMGDGAFRALYSLIVVAGFAWMILACRDEPFIEVWAVPTGLRHLPLAVMPFACLLVVLGLTTRTVTAVGGEKLLDDPHPVRGIATITRHPFLWGVTLWGLVHIAANGDLASIVMFGGVAVLALGGMAHIDHRRRESQGSAWGPVAMTSSAIPFMAVIEGRTKIDWAGIGITRPLAGLALYVVILLTHEMAFGVPVLP